MTSLSVYRAARLGGCIQATIDKRADGGYELRSTEPLGAYPERITDRLVQFAREAPERVFVAKRSAGGDWRRITYAQMLERVRSVAQALAERELSVERSVAILSENDLEHLTLALGAAWAGVPYTSVSPAYSLLSKDYGKLRHVLSTLTPGLVFASNADAYGAVLRDVVAPDAEIVLARGDLPTRPTMAFDSWLTVTPGEAEQRAHAAVGPDSIVKFLFTSGSTGGPKGVINTNRMLCSNLQMIRQCLAFLGDEPPVLVDWLPWNHTFGGNHNIGITLWNGGTLYIDDGKPTPAGGAETLRNLREISPTVYFNVPKGFEDLVNAMDHDAQLRESLFRRVKAFMFAGAGLSQAVWDRLDRHAERTIGQRIRMITGLGMTETSPTSTFAVADGVQSGHIGLPCPGVEVKLVPNGGKLEVRFRGPHVMPGYFRAPELSRQAFDEEGYYRTGDAAKFVDADDPQRGLLFDGRFAEDFKLATGTFVSVGPLRARIIAQGAPYVQDAVVAGIDRDDVGVLFVPRVDQCRQLAQLPDSASLDEVFDSKPVQNHFQTLVNRLFQAGTGSATRIARACILREPPSIDRGEITDKGSINQRAVLAHRAALVDALYAASRPDVILPQA
jgi:feruloyl-CoA synthase